MTARTAIKVERFEHVALNVTDMARTRAFYSGLLGSAEKPRPDSFTFDGAWFRIDSSVDLHVIVRKDADAAGSKHFCLFVADVKGAAEAVAAAGYPVQWEDRKYQIPGVDRFFTRDPDQNRVEIQGRDE